MDTFDEIIMFHLVGDSECYYALYESDMIDFSESEGKEVESWGIAVNGLPDGSLKIKDGVNIFVNYGTR